MSEISYRPALLADAADIHALLLQLAPEIPLLLDTLEREEALYGLVRNCARSGESWVAVNASGAVIGFALAEPAQLGRHYAEQEVLELRYAGVASAYRGRGVFGGLIERICARMMPVTAILPAQNRSAIAERLRRRGFRADGDRRLRWEPGARQG